MAENWLAPDGSKLLAYYNSSWYEYRHGVYVRLTEADMDAAIMSKLRSQYANKASSNMVEQCKRHLRSADLFYLSSENNVPFNRLTGDSLHNLINLKNGSLDPSDTTRGIRKHSPDEFFTIQLPFAYDPRANCPKFDAFLQQVQPSEKAREFLCLMLGLCLIPETKYNVLFVLYGDGGTGKSVFLHVLEHLVGKGNVSLLSLPELSGRFIGEELTCRLVNIIYDCTADGAEIGQAEGIIKKISSG